MFNYSVAKLVSFQLLQSNLGLNFKEPRKFYNNLITKHLCLPPPSVFWSKFTSERFHIFP